MNEDQERGHADNGEGRLWLVEPLNLVSYKVPEWIRADFVMQTIFGGARRRYFRRARRVVSGPDLRSLYRAAPRATRLGYVMDPDMLRLLFDRNRAPILPTLLLV